MMRGYCLIILFILGAINTRAQTEANTVKKAELNFFVANDAKGSSFNVSITYHFTQPINSDIELKVLNFDTPVANSVYFNAPQGAVQRVRFDGNDKIMSGKITQSLGKGLGSELTVFYRVPFLSNEKRFRLTIPIVYPDIPSEGNSKALFEAALEMDSKWNVYENFPAQTWSVESTDQSTVHNLSLQAVPSVIRIKGGIGPQPIFSMMNLVDGAIILVLLVLLFFGWKKIKQI